MPPNDENENVLSQADYRTRSKSPEERAAAFDELNTYYAPIVEELTVKLRGYGCCFVCVFFICFLLWLTFRLPSRQVDLGAVAGLGWESLRKPTGSRERRR